MLRCCFKISSLPTCSLLLSFLLSAIFQPLEGFAVAAKNKQQSVLSLRWKYLPRVSSGSPWGKDSDFHRVVPDCPKILIHLLQFFTIQRDPDAKGKDRITLPKMDSIFLNVPWINYSLDSGVPGKKSSKAFLEFAKHDYKHAFKNMRETEATSQLVEFLSCGSWVDCSLLGISDAEIFTLILLYKWSGITGKT